MRTKIQKLLEKQIIKESNNDPNVINLMNTEEAVDKKYQLIIDKIGDFIDKESDEGIELSALSINTLKRIYNHKDFYPDYKIENALQKTKDTLCSFLGFGNWKDVEDYCKGLSNAPEPDASRFEPVDVHTRFINTVKVGETFWVDITGGKKLQLEKRPKTYQYRVVNCIHSSYLQVNDIIEVPSFTKGIPFYASKVIRDGEYKAYYRSAKNHVIDKVRKL